LKSAPSKHCGEHPEDYGGTITGRKRTKEKVKLVSRQLKPRIIDTFVGGGRKRSGRL
jgi:hypothetical protein